MTSESTDRPATPKAPHKPLAESLRNDASWGQIATRVVVAALMLGLAGFLYFRFSDQLTLESLAQHEASLRAQQEIAPWLVIGIAFLIYVAVTGLSLPGAAALSLTYAWYFGFLRGMVLISFASTTGATIAFLTSRFLFRETVQSSFGDRLRTFNSALEKEGAFYLFTLRLIPAVPFFVINAVMGLTPIKTRTFWWVSQVGMLPGTVAYVWAGSSVPNLETLAERGVSSVLSWQILAAFTVLGLTPWALKKTVAWLKPISPTKTTS